ncbi:hypothetical protein [Azohydromonas sp.]|uniref:hypothetical protein n=1 Tax=Azohydromonas sp. TaxID=1872666 RepID=UPI002C61CDDD|nr:hypothetical protein [Azohydromonas sp.]HMM85075.1 hypothetical protein [Azohydromonas sp.]
MNNDEAEAAAKLSRILGPECAAEVLELVRSVEGDRDMLQRLDLTPRHFARNKLQRLGNLARDLGDDLHRWLDDGATGSQFAYRFAKFRNAHARPDERIALREQWRLLTDAATTLDWLAQWAAREVERLPPAKRGRKRNPGAVLIRQLAVILGMHGHPLASGSGARLVRVARQCWRQLRLTGDPHDVLRTAIERGEIDLDLLRQQLANLGALKRGLSSTTRGPGLPGGGNRSDEGELTSLGGGSSARQHLRTEPLSASRIRRLK